ncbi:MAG: deoxynucleoside kinase [Chitinophagales bacterium]|nr:deoxynucleoside kinase [Chitinophagales bacterium]
MLQSALPDPDLVIFLHAPVEKLLQQIRKRGRRYEQDISADYLLSIQQRYLEFFRTCSSFPILVVDAETLDFVSGQKHYQRLLALLRQLHTPGMHRISTGYIQ